MLFRVEQVEERPLLGVVGAGRVAERRADAAVFFLEQLVLRQLFLAAVSPVDPCLAVQHFGEGLGQAIGDRLGHDGQVIVVLRFELGDERIAANTRRHGERPEVIQAAAVERRDVVGERAEVGLPLALPLLSQHGEPGDRAAA